MSGQGLRRLGVSWLELLTAAAIAAAVLAGGCKKPDDDTEPAILPKTYTFEGKVDPKYVGHWSNADLSSVLDFAKDGALTIETVTHSQVGTSMGHIVGKWLADGDSILMSYTVGSQTPTVVKYTATLASAALTLQSPGGKAKTVYHRK